MKLTHSISKYSIAIFLTAPLFLVGARAHAEGSVREITLSNAAVEENKPVGTVVGSFSASSAAKGQNDFTKKGLVAYYPFDGHALDTEVPRQAVHVAHVRVRA